jgi:hypothetical protein
MFRDPILGDFPTTLPSRSDDDEPIPHIFELLHTLASAWLGRTSTVQASIAEFDLRISMSAVLEWQSGGGVGDVRPFSPFALRRPSLYYSSTGLGISDD